MANAAIDYVTTSTGRDSEAWDIFVRGNAPFRVEVTGQLRAHPEKMRQQLREAAAMADEIAANAPGTVIIASDEITLRPPKND